METWEIEETLSTTRLRPPETVFVLDAPIIYPRFRAVVLGLNPRFQRNTVVLGSNATRETLIHETLHRMGLGELVTYPLAKMIARLRARFPLSPRRRIRYQEQTVDSARLRDYGLESYIRLNGYQPAQVEVKRLTLI